MCFAFFQQNDADSEGMFKKPVLEDFPDLEIDYKRIVDTPMDLRTIKEVRLLEYKSIVEMQQDLVLVFQNSCKFNEEGTEIWEYTK